MKHRTYGWMALLAAVALAPWASHADGDGEEHEEHEAHGGRRRERGGPSRDTSARAAPEWAAYERECGGCHLAYPPGLLPAASWQALLARLEDHFGQNAELDAATRGQLGTFLSAWAAPRRREAPLRITELTWWRHEHDEVPPQVWRREAVGSQANCPACHAGAERGDFDEHRVRMPRDATPAR